MASIADAFRRLRLTPEHVVSGSNIPFARVLELFAGAAVSSAELRALATGLKLPLRAFTTSDLIGGQPRGLRFRNAKGSSDFDPTVERLGAFLDAAAGVLPRRNAPPDWVSYLWELSHQSIADADAVATLMRGVIYPNQEEDPAIGLPQRLDALDGVIVGQLPNSRYEGASVVWMNYVFVFVSPRFPGRMLFTLGHELGHVVAHHATEAPHYDKANEIGRFQHTEEGYADAFSAAFLLPKKGVGKTLAAVRRHFAINADEIGDVEILYISRFFGVSFDVAAIRCEALDLLPSGGAASIAARLRKEHGTPERRADALGLPPLQTTKIPKVSPRLVSAASGKINRGELSPTWLAERLGISTEQLQLVNSTLPGRSTVAH